MRRVVVFLLLVLSGAGLGYAVSADLRAWEKVVPGMDIRAAIAFLGRPHAHESDDTLIWFSKGAIVTFPLFIRIMKLRTDGCNSCGDKTYRIVSKIEYLRLFVALEPYYDETTYVAQP
jgi:hypothetical protein